MSDVVVARSEEDERWEARVGGELAAILEYRPNRAGALILVHTETLPGFEGRGVAAQLVRDVLEDVRERGERIVPLCPYVVEYLERHPGEAAGLLV